MVSLVPAGIAVVGIPMSAVAGWRAWHGWMGRNPEEMAKIWGPNHAPALMRAMPTMAVMMILAVAAIAAGTYVPSSLRAGGVAVRSVLADPLIAAACVTCVLTFSVLLVNRPRRLVPPAHRASRSLLDAWLNRP